MNSKIKEFVKLLENEKNKETVNKYLKEALECPELFVFADLLDLVSVANLASEENLYKVKLFAYGTLDDVGPGIQLSPLELKKLQLLTVLTLAQNSSCLYYKDLKNKLGLESSVKVEDFLINAVYSELITGKLDSACQCFRVESFVGRDINLDDIGKYSRKLDHWNEQIANVINSLSVAIQ